ncbi:MAG: hypothetical protein WBH86_09905 [Thermogutta sp.]|nr:hypothetical protein [Thermogutta sp.]
MSQDQQVAAEQWRQAAEEPATQRHRCQRGLTGAKKPWRYWLSTR